MNSYQVTATIVLYNNEIDELKKAIYSFLNTDLKVRLYLVDNSPTNCLESLAAIDDRIEYFFVNANNGFGAGHNEIMRKSEKLGEFHLVLNPDIYFEKGVIDSLYKYMKNNPDVGNVMPKVIFPNGNLQYLCKLLPTPLDWIGRIFIPFKEIKRHINYNFEMRFTNYDEEMNVPYLSGCFMFLRKSVIEDIGVFDEGIFMYGEDTDLNRRIYQKHRTIFYPAVTITHGYEGGSHRSFRLFKIHVKAAIYYFNKWGWFIDRERQEINHKTKILYTRK